MPVLDSTFGTGGFVALPFAPLGKNSYVANGMALQTDGKIVAGGQAGGFLFVPGDFVVARYDQHGALDPTFGSGAPVPGVVVTDFGGDDVASCLAIQKDGKIILAGWTTAHGWFEFALARYNRDGSLDASFATGGLQITGFKPPAGQASANAIALEPSNGDIITGERTTLQRCRRSPLSPSHDTMLEGTSYANGSTALVDYRPSSTVSPFNVMARLSRPDRL